MCTCPLTLVTPTITVTGGHQFSPICSRALSKESLGMRLPHMLTGSFSDYTEHRKL